MSDYANLFGRGGLNDQVDADALLSDIGLDESEIAWRKSFVGFDDADVDRLLTLQETFEDHAETIGEQFYENLLEHDQTVEVIERSPKAIDALKQTQEAYFTTLAGGDYGEEYFRNRARIGKLHDVLEMPMKHYIGQYGVYYDLILPLLADRLESRVSDRLASEWPGTAADGGTAAASGDESTDLPDSVESALDEEITAFGRELLSVLRIINLDMQVVADTYIHSYNEKVQAEAARRERLATEVEEDLRNHWPSSVARRTISPSEHNRSRG
ncbi:protoglobin domain-containing protein [Halomicroarcula sp. GCM10025709]|uniref:protoglobin domain-containing protein n=1 Tax=Halomicroarcula sp. GCM10025709 TaxID=3252669 RepID=UPI00361BE644